MSDSFLEHFKNIADPRIERCKKHQLLDILLLAISAVISGAEGWEDIEDFGHNGLGWLRKYRPFVNGIPRHDTIARVITKLKADDIEQAFQSWMKTLVQTTGTDIIAVAKQLAQDNGFSDKIHFIQKDIRSVTFPESVENPFKLVVLPLSISLTN